MKIGIDIRTTQGAQGLRGIGRYVYELVEGLVRMAPDNEYVLIAFDDLPLPPRLEAQVPPCRVACLPTRRLEGLLWRPRLGRVWRRLWADVCRRRHRRGLGRVARQEGLDVLHLPGVVDGRLFLDGNPPCRVVKTLYDLIPLAMPRQGIETWSWIDRYVYRRQVESLRHADVVVAISQSARQDAIRYLGLPPEKIRVVACAVSDEFAPITDRARLEASFARYRLCPPYFLFCSGSGTNKNQERVIEAFSGFARACREPHQLVFAGARGKDETEYVENIARRCGLSAEQFRVTGYVPDDDLVALFCGAQALVTPSLYEGFGLPAAQAMRAGTPVIASDRSSHPEVVGEAGILVDPERVDAIADALLRVARDPDLRADLAARGLKRVERFDWHHQARALLDIYQGK